MRTAEVMKKPDTRRPRPGAAILRTALRRNTGAMIAGTVLMGLYQAAETAFPIALGLIVEHTMQDRGLGSLGVSIGSLAVIITTVSLSWRFGMRVLQKANTTEAHRWRVRVAACGLQPVARDVDLKSGEILTVATEDADQTADIIEVVPLLVSSLVAVVVAAVALGLADLRLGLLVIVGTVAILSVLAVMSRRIGASTREQQARVARASPRSPTSSSASARSTGSAATTPRSARTAGSARTRNARRSPSPGSTASTRVPRWSSTPPSPRPCR